MAMFMLPVFDRTGVSGGREMPGQVARALAAVDGVGEVSVELVWSPPWTPDRMSDDAKLALDF